MNQHLNLTPKLKEVSKIEFSLENMLATVTFTFIN